MNIGVILFLSVIVPICHGQQLITFGTGLSSQWLNPTETEIFSHTLDPSSTFGVMTHFWTTGDPAIDQAVWSYYIDGETSPSIQFVTYMLVGVGFNDQQAPWGTRWIGKGAQLGGWFNNFRIPFHKSIRITGQLPASIPERKIFYVIVRGTENLPTNLGGFILPPQAKLILQKIENVKYQPIQFVPIVNIANGNGLLFFHTLAVTSGNLNFLEGCYHAYVDYSIPAYYFNAGQFHFDVSGYTHHKEENGTVEWSAYRFHDQDPIFFTNGFRFDWRNGDVVDDNGFKCILESGGHQAGSPTESTVTSYAWVYIW
ncbi:unnamed protein product [Didymodactylos carnosus]|uniref:Uncharacterized protein n=1 Tax=Didymodactylos carnosus TaxID=1234261 RepID=A0A8S2V9H4_9BILA|nr:unnamed protein product [Didymodactylos carnosus]CAF4379124.1 unnamed protein product [Didymodactylos carnosus]